MIKQTLATQVANEVRRRILDGEWSEGTQLRQELVAKLLNVSHVPVREAFRQLAMEGFVVLLSHRGAVVAPLSPNELREFYEMRLRLETWLLQLAIPNMKPANIRAAEAMQRELENAVGVGRHNELNWQFHEALYRPADRATTLETLAGIHRRTLRYARAQVLLIPQEPIYQEHWQIIEACRQKDIGRATERLEAHIMNGLAALMPKLNERAGGRHPGPADRPSLES